MERHTRHDLTPHAPRRPRGPFGRRIARGLAGPILLAGLFGCGGHEATTDAVLFVGAEDANWTLADNYGDGTNLISPALPIQVLVRKSADDTTPIPGVDVTILVSGQFIALPTVLDPETGAILDNGNGVYQTVTDDHGSVVVDPVAFVTGCTSTPPEDVSISGNLSLAMFISTDSAAWNGKFTYTCKGPPTP